MTDTLTQHVSEVPSLTIQENSGRRRTVTLTARGLPMRPYTLDGEQRVKITNANGNPVGWGSVSGPTEGETEINGYWKDKYLTPRTGEPAPIQLNTADTVSRMTGGMNINQTDVTSALDAIQLLDSIRREGQHLTVQWGFIIRYGFLKKFTQKWHTIHDVEWSATFAWTSQAYEPESPLFGPQAGQLETGSALRNALDQFARILDTPGQVVGGYMDDARNTLNRLDQFSRTLDDAVSGFTDSLISPAEIGSRIQSTIGSFITTAQDLADRVEDAGWTQLFTDPMSLVPFSADPPSFTTSDTGAAEVAAEAQAVAGLLGIPVGASVLDEIAMEEMVAAANDGIDPTDPMADIDREIALAGAIAGVVSGGSVAAEIAAEDAIAAAYSGIDPNLMAQMQLYERETRSDAIHLRNEAAARLRQASSPSDVILATYTAREGDDLRDVARIYYGDPTQWRQLLIFNGLSSSSLFPGQVIQVPRLQDGSSADA